MAHLFYFYANPYQPHSAEAARALAHQLESRGGVVYGDGYLASQGIGREAQLTDVPAGTRAIVAFGGDGTLLRAAPEGARQHVPLLGVHTGTVGFLMAGDAQRPRETADLLLAEEYPLTTYPLLAVRYQDKCCHALNDVSLTRGEHPGVIEVSVFADGERVFCCHGDGVVVSTPLGSTAYGLSAGGPIVRPDVPCVTVTPLAARELLLRPVILPAEAHLTVTAHGGARRRLQLAIDGQTLLPVTEEARVEIGPDRLRALLIHPAGRAFFSTLRKKQGIWNQQEEQE